MGEFSWLRADKKQKRKNIAQEDVYKILIPKEFGGGSIKDKYDGYGKVYYYDDTKEIADLYGILAYWNKCDGMQYTSDHYPSTMEEILKYGDTTSYNNRCKGIDIGCYDHQIDKLKYPLKLVSVSYTGTYEECKGKSYKDPDKGVIRTYWTTKDLSEEM